MNSEFKFISHDANLGVLFTLTVLSIFFLSIIEVISVLPVGLLLKYFFDIPFTELETSVVTRLLSDVNLSTLSVLSLVSIVLSAVASFSTLYLHSNLVWTATHKISALLFDVSLFKADPFSESFDLAVARKNIATEAQQYSFYGIGSLANILGRATAAFFLVLLLIANAPGELLLSFFTIFLTFSFGILLLSKRIKNIGREREQYASQIFQNIDQTASSLAMIQSLKRESYFFNLFLEASDKFRAAANSFMILPQIPRIAIDFIVFATVVALINLFSNFDMLLHDSTVYAILAVMKFIPGLNILFRSVNERQYAVQSYDTITSVVKNNMGREKEITQTTINKMSMSINIIPSFDVSMSQVYEINDIVPGNIILLSGKSGSGKSSILQCLSGISSKPWVNINIRTMSGDKKDFREFRNGYLPQNLSLINGTLSQNIFFGEVAQRRNLDQILRDVGLESLVKDLDTPVFNLTSRFSGGEIQRIGMARLIYDDPDIVFLDEPTSALDSENEELIVQIIQKFSEGGKIIFLATHSDRLKSIATQIVSLGEKN